MIRLVVRMLISKSREMEEMIARQQEDLSKLVENIGQATISDRTDSQTDRRPHSSMPAERTR
jgi:hypothetical protein